MSREERQIQRQLAHVRSIDAGRIIDPGKRFEYGVKDLKTGDVYRLNNQTYLVLEVGVYTETDENFQRDLDWTGHELKSVCLETGVAHNLEWEEDDEIEASLTLSEIKMSALRYDDGEAIAADSDDLDEIVEKGWDVKYQEKLFHVEDDFAAWWTPGEGARREKVFFYEFESDDGEALTIEVWPRSNNKEDFQVFLSRSINPDNIEVIASGAP
ncbi:MAG: DUF4178 domain-containing protein [Desulfobacterales bacterium]|nr:DUF4178 domain-containing protein [Desulfobacterales bacterium]